MTDEQREQLIAAAKPMLEDAEKRIPHFYRDNRGNVTIGVGHKVLHAEDAIHLDLQPEEFRAVDFSTVAIAPIGFNAAHYGTLCTSRMSDSTMNRLLDVDVRRFVAQLETRLPQLGAWRTPWQKAVLDMAYNLGVAGFMAYKQLISALDRGDGEEAARQCFRHGLGDTPAAPGERNLRTAELFRSLG